MLQHIRDFAAVCAQSLPLPAPVYEFGSYQVEDHPVDGDLRPLFPDVQFVGADMRPGPGVDVTLDLHHLDLPDSSVGTALLFDTLEHVERPWEAIAEVQRVLTDEGMLVLSVPFSFPIHSYPNDYWRFTPEGVRSLLRPFAEVWVSPIGDPGNPLSVVAVAAKGVKGEQMWDEFESVIRPHIQLWDALMRHWEQEGYPTG